MKKNIAVLCGGYSAEHNISMWSGEVVFKNLDPSKYNAYKVVVDKTGWHVLPQNAVVDLNDFSFTAGDKKIKFDVAFIAIHGSPGEDGKIQGYFDMLNIPYTTSGVAASSLTFNKSICKSLVMELDIPMAKGMLITRHNGVTEKTSIIQNQFNLPLFIKPNNNGSSYGVEKIKTFETLQSAILNSFDYDDEVLVEEGISGTEVTCGVYSYINEIVVLPLCEVVTDKHDFFDYTAKYTTGESDEIIPARIDESVAEKVITYSLNIYRHLNCKGVIRIDYIIKNNLPHFLEVNTVPGLSENSIVPKMAMAAGLSLPQFFSRLIEQSL